MSSFRIAKDTVACDVYDGVFLCCPFSPRGVLDEILNLIESVSEGFPSNSHIIFFFQQNNEHSLLDL